MIILREQTGAGFKTNTLFQAGKVVIIAISTVCTKKEAFHVTSFQAIGENHATFGVTMLCAIVNVQRKTREYFKSLNQATKNFNSWGFFSFQSFLLCDSFFKIAPSIKHQIATQTFIKKLQVCQVYSAVRCIVLFQLNSVLKVTYTKILFLWSSSRSTNHYSFWLFVQT